MKPILINGFLFAWFIAGTYYSTKLKTKSAIDNLIVMIFWPFIPFFKVLDKIIDVLLGK